MDETTVYNPQTGKSEKTKSQYLQGFLNSGWTTSPTTAPVDNSMLQGGVTPQIKTAPQPTGDSAYFESLVDSTKEQDAEATRVKELETKMQSDEQGIAGLLTQIGGAGQKQEEFIQQEGGDVAKKEYDQYTAQLKAEQLALRRKQEALDKNPQGLFGGALQDEKNRIERESLSKQADLSILQETARGNYETAYDIAERKTQAYLAPLKTQLEIKKFFFENNKDLFNKAEQRQYDAKMKKEEREYDKIEKEKTDSSNLIKNAIAQGASSGVITKALDIFNKNGSSVDVARALGVYAGDVLDNQYKKAQIAKIYQDINDSKFVNKTGKLSEAQRASANYANRIEFSNKILDDLAETTSEMSFAKFKLLESESSVANTFLTPKEQQVGQAMRNFITAKLRKESGASISPTEFAEARKQYFPQYGDSKEVLAQKKANRELAFKGEVDAAGAAYSPLSEDIMSNVGVNPFKATLTGNNNIFNQSTGQWIIPMK